MKYRTKCPAVRRPSLSLTSSPSGGCGRPKSGAAESCPISTMPRRMARVRVKCSNSASPSPRRIARVSFDRSSLKLAEHFQHGFLVVQEHVAPHRRIGRRDAGEIAKTAGGELDHFGSRHLRQFVRRADDGVGDQMRQMAGDRQHQVVMLGVMVSTLAPMPAQNARKAFDRHRVAAVGRRQDAPAVDEQFGEAGIRSGIFGAGDRMRRNEMHVIRQMRRHLAHDGALDRADVGDDRAGFQDAARFPARPAPQAPTGTQRMTRSASFTASALVSSTWSTMPSSSPARASFPSARWRRFRRRGPALARRARSSRRSGRSRSARRDGRSVPLLIWPP